MSDLTKGLHAAVVAVQAHTVTQRLASVSVRDRARPCATVRGPDA